MVHTTTATDRVASRGSGVARAAAKQGAGERGGRMPAAAPAWLAHTRGEAGRVGSEPKEKERGERRNNRERKKKEWCSDACPAPMRSQIQKEKRRG